jgi:hypothetical protein
LVDRKGKHGKITFGRSASGTTVTLDFSKAGEYMFVQKFKIVSVQ